MADEEADSGVMRDFGGALKLGRLGGLFHRVPRAERWGYVRAQFGKVFAVCPRCKALVIFEPLFKGMSRHQQYHDDIDGELDSIWDHLPAGTEGADTHGSEQAG
jgi:hypothetical protein